MFIKEQITKNFNKGAINYDDHSHAQQKSADLLIAFMQENCKQFNPTTILDVGSGTGYVTKELLKIYPNSMYSINDISCEMINATKSKFNKYDNIVYSLADIEQLEITYHDLIISNFTLQWVKNLPCTINRLFSKSKILALSLPVQGTFSEWFELYGPSAINQYLSFQEIELYCQTLKPKHLFCTQHTINIEFENVLSFLKHLKLIGANTSPKSYPDFINLRKIINKQSEQLFQTKYEAMLVVLISD